MSDNKDKQRSKSEAKIEEDIRLGRKFTMEEAIGRMVGPGAMKGISPVTGMQQAVNEIENWLVRHMPPGNGDLKLVLLRSFEVSEILLHHYERAGFALGAYCRQILDSEYLLKELVRETLNDPTLTPRQRLERYLEVITDKLKRDRWMIGCLIGDFSLQASSHSNLLRKRLDAIFKEWRALFASCIAAAQCAGEVDSNFRAEDLAEFLLTSWQGAILRMKVERSPVALERFRMITFATVFKQPRNFLIKKARSRMRKRPR